jgi:beta-lysine 5,6-aminomutase beta subunit
MIRPYGDHENDGMVELRFTLPCDKQSAARRIAEMMGLENVEIIDAKRLTGLHSHFTIFAVCPHSVNEKDLPAEPDPQWLEKDRIEELAESIGRPIVVVGASTGTDTHSVGLDAICNLKGWNGHHGLESYKCFEVHNLGSQVPNADLVAKAAELDADAILVSATVTQQDLHVFNLKQLARIARADSARSMVLVAGGHRMTDQEAKSLGFDHGFGKNTLPEHVATTVVRAMLERQSMADRERAAERAFGGELRAVA